MQQNICSENKPELLKIIIRSFYNGSLQYSISKICRKYLQKTINKRYSCPLLDLYCDEDVEKFTLECQQYFLDATVNSELLKKYPVNSEFSRLFFKKLLQIIENKHDVHDDFYTFLCSVMTNKRDKEFCYRHYIIGNNYHNIITLKETNNIVVNGTTGLRTWEAALMLADWALTNPNIFKSKHILELGSGTGFTGITVAKMCELNSMMLTDCHADVLKTINENIEINFPGYKYSNDNTTLFSSDIKSLSVSSLDWNDIGNNFSFEIKPDILIGADIIYDPLIIEPLCNTIKYFLDKNKDLEVFIANVIRNQNTCSAFLKTLESMNISWEVIHSNRGAFIQWDFNVPIVLYKLKNKPFII